MADPVALTNVTVYFQFLTIEAATSATAEYQILDDVVHVSVFPPITEMNGGLTEGTIYDIEGTDPDNTGVVLPEQTFDGFSSQGVARFARAPQEGVGALIGGRSTAARKLEDPAT